MNPVPESANLRSRVVASPTVEETLQRLRASLKLHFGERLRERVARIHRASRVLNRYPFGRALSRQALDEGRHDVELRIDTGGQTRMARETGPPIFFQ